ncbi:cytochrome C oxidase Cbb3 [Fulvivirga ligni]|uniref:cytochrome C oxidase Cbb3 n=1 Tax=Fulvivirga ligni TaxID=2904246 RepID=UPI001F1A0B16|nr:cytochrome C oxidase Cbb3 [Fulvivirga ligni]UII19098.1 cytochrome C oxidase Cbb3 [Fulvivirga ligni]
MFKHYFEQVHNVEVWPIISLAIFFIFFLCLILWVIQADKGYISKMKQLPVDDATLSTSNPEES